MNVWLRFLKELLARRQGLLGNQAYYRLVRDNPRYYFDYTGTDNTLNVPHPRVLQMMMD